jgi:hypothetical protein
MHHEYAATNVKVEEGSVDNVKVEAGQWLAVDLPYPFGDQVPVGAMFFFSFFSFFCPHHAPSTVNNQQSTIMMTLFFSLSKKKGFKGFGP